MPGHIRVFKVTRSSVEELHFELPDFDSITMELPSGLYTTFRTYAGRRKAIGLRVHLDRLYLPAKARGVRVDLDQRTLRQELASLLDLVAPHEARVRLILDPSKEVGEFYVLLQPLRELPQEAYRQGIRVELSQLSREKPSLKQTSFIAESSSERGRIQGETFEILLTHNARILEGMTSNFFYVRDGTLATPGRGALSGVTRQTVLEIAKEASIPVRYRALPVRDIPAVDEAFITSSSRGIVPVVRIEDQPIGNGKVGNITERLMELYEQKVSETAEAII